MTNRGDTELDDLAVDTIRLLSADMVEAARSGHPGMPMGCAAMAWALWSRHLRHDPGRPDWPDRDRFVLSAGHGSALLYALLHLFGYDLPMAQLRAFRQLGSATPGHPEFGHTVGVETTTGPLGQGFANAVGMALAERMLHARFPAAVDHRTYVIVGDGCLMEGISHEAASLAGHLGLGRLVVLYDDNDVTIDGPASQSCRDDVRARFAAYGWHTAAVPGGNDVAAIDRAIGAARLDPRPSLIAVRTVIGYGAPGVAGSAAAHGSPLGPEVLAATRRRLGRSPEPFHVPSAVRDRCRSLAATGAAQRAGWVARFDDWARANPVAAAEWRRCQAGGLPTTVDTALADLATGGRLATRQASAQALAAAGAVLPELVGGSADLAGSTGLGALPGAVVAAGDYGGRRIHFGVREHAMAAALNGIAAHGGLRPVGSTFLAFSDYLRPALRLCAMMRLPVVHVLTHDSIAVGEDGPTHQPVEHIESLRLIPGLAVLRPADDAETAAAWYTALRRTDGPTALILSRQGLPALGPAEVSFITERGARIVGPPVDEPAVTILATGSEVALAVAAAERLTACGRPTRVVSVPWRERFADLSPAEQEALTGRPARLVAVEAGVPTGWAAHVGAGNVLGLSRFGVCGPGEQVLASLGFTVELLVALVERAPVAVADGGADA
ncbi:transketolase [Dactylosporangium sp. CA-233914]|uniref:transketolase n=1 Tax=Dactylosporangium sp. CA-233914 TaxID=3239934 RepID=UPI003D8C92DC